MSRIQVLLATFNGGAYLGEQLTSILSQTLSDFEILIGDDCSIDRTRQVIDDITEQDPGRVKLLFGSRAGGAVPNFLRLLKAATADYLLFSDQDDVWLPEKIQLALDLCVRLEGNDRNVPVLIHSDLVVVDADLRVIADSMFSYQQLDPSAVSLSQLLMRGQVTGCTVMINRALADLVLAEDQPHMMMHDWWVSLLAAAFGTIGLLDRPTVLYRQHGGNQLGARKPGDVSYFTRRVLDVVRSGKLNRPLRKILEQASAFDRRYGDRLRPEDRNASALIASLARASPLRLRYELVRRGLLRGSLLSKLAALVTV